MIRRLVVLVAVMLCAIAIGALPSAGIGGLVGAADAQAQEPAPADPDAGLDDTALGPLDQTDLGTPVDQVDVPPTANPAPPAGAPPVGAPPAGAPPAGVLGPSGSGAFAPPPIYVIINVPKGSSGKATPNRQRAKKHRRQARKRKLAHKRRQEARKRKHANRRRHTRGLIGSWTAADGRQIVVSGFDVSGSR